MTTWVHKVKCMRCSLHFAAFSWSDEWTPKRCPECGTDVGFLSFQPEHLTDQIFEHIPGKSGLKSIG